MYDSTCKFIALEYSRDLATWLSGKPLDLTEIKPSELSLEPIRADSLIFLESEELILHIEFQTDILRMVASRDGRWLVTGDRDSAIALWRGI